MSVRAELGRHLSIVRQYVRIGLVRKSQFRVEFLTQVLMDVVWAGTQLLLFEILYLHTASIAGWRPSEMRVFLGFVFVSDGFLMAFMGQMWHFGRELKDGRLDPVRVRPASTLFLYCFQRFSLEGAVNLTLSVGFLTWALAHGGWLSRPVTWLVLPAALAMSFFARVTISVLFSVAEFHFLHSDSSQFLTEALLVPAERPLDVFTRRMRAFLLFAVPVGVVGYVPASLAVGRLGPLAGLCYAVFIAGFGLFTFRLWNRGFRRYESAMS